MSVIRYQPLDNGEGLALVDKEIVAYRDGREVARGGWAPEGDRLEELLARFAPVHLIPSAEFAYGDAGVQVFEIDVRDDVMASEAGGLIRCGERAAVWNARRVREGAIERWAIHVPVDVTAGDPIVEARLMAILGTLLDDLLAGRERALPLVQEVDNVFGQSKPAPNLRYGPVRLADWLRAHPAH